MKAFAYLIAAAALAVAPAPLLAHPPHIGPAGGQTIHWGPYHFEFVPGANGSRIHVYRASDRRPVPTARISATARLLAGGRVATVRFQPSSGNMLASPQARLSGDWTASVTITMPGATPTIRYSSRELAALRRAGASR